MPLAPRLGPRRRLRDGSPEHMFGAEQPAPRPGPHRHGSRCQHADIHTRRHLRGASVTHRCAHTHTLTAGPSQLTPCHRTNHFQSSGGAEEQPWRQNRLQVRAKRPVHGVALQTLFTQKSDKNSTLMTSSAIIRESKP